MNKKFKLVAIVAFVTLISCNSNKREEPPNDDVLSNDAYINLIEYTYDDSNLIINAETNFPEETKIKISIFGYVKSTKAEKTSDTYGNSFVRDGKIKIELKPWNVPQQVDFIVSVDEQNKYIADLFGVNGKNIKVKDKNKHINSPSIAVFVENYDINKELIAKLKDEEPKTFKYTQLNELSHQSEKTLANFINCMRDRNWSKMVKYTQKSQNETSKSLNDMFSMIESIDGFEIIKRDQKSINYNVITFKIYIQNGIKHRGIQEKIITANVIKENGVWGVNATSATGGLYN